MRNVWVFSVWDDEMPSKTLDSLFLRRKSKVAEKSIHLISLEKHFRCITEILLMIFIPHCVFVFLWHFKVTLMCVHISEWVCFSLMKTCVFLDHWHPRVNCLKRCVCVLKFLFTWGNTGFRGKGLIQCNVCVSLSSWVSKARVSTYPDWSVSNVASGDAKMRWNANFDGRFKRTTSCSAIHHEPSGQMNNISVFITLSRT